MTERTVKDTDNRDPYTTVLILDNGDTVSINPVELIENVLINLSKDSDADTSVIDELHDLLNGFGL